MTAAVCWTSTAQAGVVLSNPKLYSYKMPGPTSYVSAGPDGNMYVAAGRSVVKMSPRGAVLATYALPAAVDQMTPLGSSLYLTYAAGTVLAALPTSGGPITTVDAGLALSVGALTTGPDGNLWEGALGLIFRAQPDGQLVEYSSPETPNAPNSINAIKSAYGKLWYTNPSTNKIGTITTTGYLTEYGPLAAAPHGIAFAPNNSLYFTEPSQGIVGRITTGGAITQWRTNIPAPTDVVTGPDGNEWITGTQTVARFSPAGRITFFKGGGNNAGIAVGSDNASIWFATGQSTVDVLR
ncbi:MAG: hypothetical protein GIX03_04615 [Candidatus Eremiobacteraeota bacterium]|nr:hypothetical protein [Candidatus Eremiobacteraeota bacterium]